MRRVMPRVAAVPDVVRTRGRTFTASAGSILHPRRGPVKDPALWATGIVVFVLSWPVASIDAEAGLDPSWQIGLHQAVHQGLDFGPEMLFTYGPLGFLTQPILVWPWTTRLAFAYTLA